MKLLTDLALELLGDITGSSGDLFCISMTLSDKYKQVVLDFSTEDLLCTLVVEFNDQRQRFGLDKLDDSFGGNFSLKSNLGTVKVLKQ